MSIEELKARIASLEDRLPIDMVHHNNALIKQNAKLREALKESDRLLMMAYNYPDMTSEQRAIWFSEVELLSRARQAPTDNPPKPDGGSE